MLFDLILIGRLRDSNKKYRDHIRVKHTAQYVHQWNVIFQNVFCFRSYDSLFAGFGDTEDVVQFEDFQHILPVMPK